MVYQTLRHRVAQYPAQPMSVMSPSTTVHKFISNCPTRTYVLRHTVYLSPKAPYNPSLGGSGGCRNKSSEGKFRTRVGKVGGPLIVDLGVPSLASWALRSSLSLVMFSGAKDLQKNGGGGKGAARLLVLSFSAMMDILIINLVFELKY